VLKVAGTVVAALRATSVVVVLGCRIVSTKRVGRPLLVVAIVTRTV
jgi:hypothetical protein